MSQLFYNLKNIDADISSWDTSSVTNMWQMFRVRSARALAPSLELGPLHARRLRRRHPMPSRSRGPHLAPHRMPPFRLGSSRRRSTSR